MKTSVTSPGEAPSSRSARRTDRSAPHQPRSIAMTPFGTRARYTMLVFGPPLSATAEPGDRTGRPARRAQAARARHESAASHRAADRTTAPATGWYLRIAFAVSASDGQPAQRLFARLQTSAQRVHRMVPHVPNAHRSLSHLPVP